MGDIAEDHEDRFTEICDSCGEFLAECECFDDFDFFEFLAERKENAKSSK